MKPRMLLTALLLVSTPDHLKGTSLTPVLQDVSHPGKEVALTDAWSRAAALHMELKGKRILGHSLKTAQYRYTLWGDGEYGQELYDYEHDPQEMTNLADKAEFSGTLASLQRLLKQARERASPALVKE